MLIQRNKTIDKAPAKNNTLRESAISSKGTFSGLRSLLSPIILSCCLVSPPSLQCSLIAATAFTAAGCSSSSPAFNSLLNKGVMPVSSDTPFIGANLYLAKQMEESLYLYSFIKNRGSPRAIELIDSGDTGTVMNLYYATNKELYKATPQLDPISLSKEWIISGPYPLDRENYRQVLRLGRETSGVFEIFGRREVIGENLSLTGTISAGAGSLEGRNIEPVFIPTPPPRPTPALRATKKHTLKENSNGKTTSPKIIGTPATFDQEALLEARKQATDAAKGDNTQSKPKTETPKIDEALTDVVNKPAATAGANKSK